MMLKLNRWVIGLAQLCMVLTGVAGAADTKAAYHFIVLRFDFYIEPPQELKLRSTDGRSHLTLNRSGLFFNQSLLCDWSVAGLGQVGAKKACPADSPVQDASVFGFSKESAEATPFTGIRLNSIHENQIEVSYQGQSFKGEIPYVSYKKIVPAKGSPLEKQLVEESKKLKMQREAELEKLGLAQLRQGFQKCLAPLLRPLECLIPFLPSEGEKFSLKSEPGEDAQLSGAQFHRRLSTDKEFLKTVLSCMALPGPAYRLEGDQVSIQLDEEAERGWHCDFKRKNMKWVFTELSWVGC